MRRGYGRQLPHLIDSPSSTTPTPSPTSTPTRPYEKTGGSRRRRSTASPGCAGDGRSAARLPGDPRDGHERQGLDVADDHPPADGQRAHRRHVHQSAPRADQRAHRPQLRADRRRRLRRADRRRRRPRGVAGVPPGYFEAVTAAAFRGSPTSPSTSPWSRSGCSADGTRPTWSTPRSPSSRTSAWTTPSSPARRSPTSPARRRASSSRQRGVIGETDPTSSRSSRPSRQPRACSAARLRRRHQPARARRPARRSAHADHDLSRGVRPAARRPPGRQCGDRARRRRGVLRRPARRRRRREGFAAVGSTGGSRCWSTSRS